MDELRVVRREEQSLIVATEAGEEFRLVVDSSVLAELRHLAKAPGEGVKVSPREIQSLVRAGKTRAEISAITGADEIDIERYEEPVLAERRFILQSAHDVAVRTSASEQAEQQFGTVIAERLVGLNAKDVKWAAWRDEEAGWMIGLDFTSFDVAHRAVWSFEHRKGALSPITPDATSLSKLGDVGDRLIPKLRAVDSDESSERFDSGAFDHEKLLPDDSSAHDQDRPDDTPATDLGESSNSGLSPATEAALRAGHPSTGSIPVIDVDAEFARRKEIDQRAIKTPEPDVPDLGQTADLLDALRRRRDQRDEPAVEPETAQPELPVPVPIHRRDDERDADAAFRAPNESGSSVASPMPEARDEQSAPSGEPTPPEPSKRSKGRASIPSWDDILFGTRSEEDPS